MAFLGFLCVLDDSVVRPLSRQILRYGNGRAAEAAVRSAAWDCVQAAKSTKTPAETALAERHVEGVLSSDHRLINARRFVAIQTTRLRNAQQHTRLRIGASGLSQTGDNGSAAHFVAGRIQCFHFDKHGEGHRGQSLDDLLEVIVTIWPQLRAPFVPLVLVDDEIVGLCLGSLGILPLVNKPAVRLRDGASGDGGTVIDMRKTGAAGSGRAIGGRGTTVGGIFRERALLANLDV